MQVVPRVLGFDARLQFLHPRDAVESLLTVTRRDLPGTFNVAADDMVTLSQALRRMGRVAVGVPQPVAPVVAGLFRQARLTDFSADQIDALTYGRGMDTTRFRQASGLTPRYSTREALNEFVASASPGIVTASRVESVLQTLGRMVATPGSTS
jgi:UDP-glucose 4-epimerase